LPHYFSNAEVHPTPLAFMIQKKTAKTSGTTMARMVIAANICTTRRLTGCMFLPEVVTIAVATTRITIISEMASEVDLPLRTDRHTERQPPIADPHSVQIEALRGADLAATRRIAAVLREAEADS